MNIKINPVREEAVKRYSPYIIFSANIAEAIILNIKSSMPIETVMIPCFSFVSIVSALLNVNTIIVREGKKIYFMEN